MNFWIDSALPWDTKKRLDTEIELGIDTFFEKREMEHFITIFNKY